jgi:hypothetical protein
MVHNIKFIVCCIQCLENFRVLQVGQKIFLKLTNVIVYFYIKILIYNFFPLKVESA